MSSQPLRVAFVGGHGRSGSTLLARMLACTDSIFAAGEVCYIWEQGVLRDRMCSCGNPFSSCGFWQAVGQRAFGGWSEDVARRGLALRKAVDRNRFVPRLAAPRAFPGHAAALHEYACMYGDVLRSIRDVSGAKVVIDISKNPSTGYLLRQVKGIDLRVVHLVRDVHGVAYSWSKFVSRPDRDGAAMTQLSYRRTTIEWAAFNAMVEGLGALGVPRALIRYEDLIREPEATLRRVLSLVDVPEAHAPLDFIDGSDVQLASGHEVTGNVMRFRSGTEHLRLDEEWRTALPAGRRRAISVGAAPALLRYGYLPARRVGA